MASFTMLCYALDSKHTIPYAPSLPRVPDNRLPIAGDTVTYRQRGTLHTATVMSVGVGDFDEPVFYLSTRVTVLRYSITGVMEGRVAA